VERTEWDIEQDRLKAIAADYQGKLAAVLDLIESRARARKAEEAWRAMEAGEVVTPTAAVSGPAPLKGWIMRIVELVEQAGDEGLSVQDAIRLSGKAVPTVRSALSAGKTAGLLESAGTGRYRWKPKV
jgi:hypothetical protein